MLLIESNTVRCLIAPVRPSAELATNCHLRGETDYADANLVTDQSIDGLVDISRVGRQQGSKDDENLSGAMAGRVTIGMG